MAGDEGRTRRAWSTWCWKTPELLRKRVKAIQKVFNEYEEAKRELSGGNLRLVVSIAKKYRNRGLSFLDIIQEGNTGLMRAVDKYEYRRGYKFSHLRHVVDSPGHHPGHRRPCPHHPHPGAHDRDDEQAAEHLQEAGAGARPRADHRGNRRGGRHERDRGPARAEDFSRHPISLDRPVGESEDSYFGDFIEDETAENPVEIGRQEMLKDRIEQVLKTLTYREREIIKLRYGIGDGYTYTLEEVGRIFKVTRERVRQVEAKAIRKLQHPVRAQKARRLPGREQTV